MSTNDSLLWQVRHFVYNHFADTTHPPSVEEAATHFNISLEEASAFYQELHNRHAIFLQPETLTIRMANPFSGIPTDFKVHANGKTYYANSAAGICLASPPRFTLMRSSKPFVQKAMSLFDWKFGMEKSLKPASVAKHPRGTPPRTAA